VNKKTKEENKTINQSRKAKLNCKAEMSNLY